MADKITVPEDRQDEAARRKRSPASPLMTILSRASSMRPGSISCWSAIRSAVSFRGGKHPAGDVGRNNLPYPRGGARAHARAGGGGHAVSFLSGEQGTGGPECRQAAAGGRRRGGEARGRRGDARHDREIPRCGIPVMGHVGLTPQSIHRFGGYKIQGKVKTQSDAIYVTPLR